MSSDLSSANSSLEFTSFGFTVSSRSPSSDLSLSATPTPTSSLIDSKTSHHEKRFAKTQNLIEQSQYSVTFEEYPFVPPVPQTRFEFTFPEQELTLLKFRECWNSSTLAPCQRKIRKRNERWGTGTRSLMLR